MTLRIIGDTHGKYQDYLKLLPQKSDDFCTLQIGDMGFDYSFLQDVDYHRNRFFGGNHDSYDRYYNIKHSIGDYGSYSLGGETFFFVRGAYSVDKDYRIKQEKRTGLKSWWKEEELGIDHKQLILDLYRSVKPYLVITHDCPQEVSALIGNPDVLADWGLPKDFCSTTNDILQSMFEIHQPDLWIFGHYHHPWSKIIKGAEFRCLDELEYVDLEMYK